MLIALLYMPLFGHLDALVIRTWDEARLANNAYEMLNNGNYIVTYCDGEPDMWNTKPPLMIWLQVLFMKLIGVNELAVRLPSAIAGLLTCLIILCFFYKYLGNYTLGFISILVLITTAGYSFIDLHGTRTGDYDALLTLFTTLHALCYFLFLENKKQKYLIAFFFFLSLATFTKGIAGLLLLPGIFIYTVYKNEFFAVLKNYRVYLYTLLSILLISSYYYAREQINPGYIEAVIDNELGGRFHKALEGHKEPFEFYFLNVINEYFKPWYYFIPLSLVAIFYTKNILLKKLGVFCAICSVSFILIISIAETKITWYAMPSFPFIAIIIALFINYLYELIISIEKEYLHEYTKPILGIAFLFILFVSPYRNVLDRTYLPKETGWDKEDFNVGYFLRNALNGKEHFANYIFVHKSYNIQNLFYINLLNEKGQNIQCKYYFELNTNDIGMAYEADVKELIKSNYNIDIIKTFKNVEVYKIISHK